jgi:hypothetical protein
VAIAITVDRQRVDREDFVAGGDEGTDQQSTVQLDANEGFFGFLNVVGDHLVELGDPLDTIRYPPLSQDAAFLINDANIVVLLGPVNPDEDQTSLLSTRRQRHQPREDRWRSNGSVPLMARHPTSPHLSSPTGGGTI